jgi:hypothetical protein
MVASIVGSFCVYGAHVACGPSLQTARVVPPVPAATSSASSPIGATSSSGEASAPKDAAPAGSCGCASAKTVASFAFSGDEKIVLDPLDAHASLDVTYARGPGGKRQIVLSAVVRAYRTDVAAERATTVAIRAVLPDTMLPTEKAPASSKDGAQANAGHVTEAYVTTWGAGSVVAPRSYASVAKSALTYTVTDSVVEMRGSITLKDVAANRVITLEKLLIKKVGAQLLPERSGAYRAP